MNKFYYFVFGEFNPTGYGYNYDYNQQFFEVYANTYEAAYQVVYMKCVEKYGLQNYKDMWYGLEAYNWKIEPRSKYYFDKLSNGKNIETLWQE